MMFQKQQGIIPTHLDVLCPDVVDAEQLGDLEDRLEVSGDLLMRWYRVLH
ncbi:hypothetical protein [Curtobacterium sp. 'Ferrero']|nr:hypothetical protein [Curtobacterium sp. 'Ferrero']